MNILYIYLLFPFSSLLNGSRHNFVPRNPRHLFNIHLRYSNNIRYSILCNLYPCLPRFLPSSRTLIPFSNGIRYILGNNNNNHQYNLAIASNLYRWYRRYSNWPTVTDFTRRTDIPPVVLAVISKLRSGGKLLFLRGKKSEKWYCQSNFRHAIRPL